jgi:PIN domain nuclease of toxin-antitoxin system
VGRLNLLLDTHILLWWLAGSRRLPKTARKLIANSASAYVSAVSVWEIEIKQAVKRLDFGGDIEKQLALNHFLPLHVTIPHAIAAGRLPLYHADPLDRMLVAQASVESLTLMTSDAILERYEARVMVV